MFPKIVVTPNQIIHFNRVFHYKPSILGYPSFWKHPFQVCDIFGLFRRFDDAWRSGHANANTFTLTGAGGISFNGRGSLPVCIAYEKNLRGLGIY